MILTTKVYEEMKWHATRESPRECVGLLGIKNDVVQRCFPLNNLADDPFQTFEADPEGMALAYGQLRGEGWRLATYHSHPQGAACLSKRDIKQLWPGFPHLVIGMGTGYQVRAFVVQRTGQVDEHQFTVELEGQLIA